MNPTTKVPFWKYAVFTLLRFLAQTLPFAGSLLFMAIFDDEIVPFIICSVFLYLVLAFVPHFFIKLNSFGKVTLCNLVVQPFFAILPLILIMVLYLVTNNEAAGWFGFLLVGMIFIVPACFVVNLLIDLIAVFAINRHLRK